MPRRTSPSPPTAAAAGRGEPAAGPPLAALIGSACDRLLGLHHQTAGAVFVELATMQFAALNPAMNLLAGWSLYDQTTRGIMGAARAWFDTVLDTQIELARDVDAIIAGQETSLPDAAAIARSLLGERRRLSVVIKFPDRRAQLGRA